MHKTLIVSSLALVLAGCANQQGPAQPVQVQDLSSTRVAESDVPAQYTVEAGDTLYGIAWRHNMDFQELAKLNNISPPYRIGVGQTLVLQPGAQGQQVAQAQTGNQEGAVATPLGSAGANATAAAGSEDLEWLLPDGSTETVSSSGGGQVTGAAAAGAVAAAGASMPGPVQNCSSPGANCTAEEAQEAVVAAAEREAQQQQEQQQQEQQQQEQQQQEQQQVSAEDASSTSQQSAESPSSSSSSSASSSSRKTYTPAENISWQWPVDGQVVSGYGEDTRVTKGIDIGGQKGQPVKAAGPGIVVYAGDGVSDYGNLVMIRHNDEYLSVYAYNDSLNVKENDVVDAGQVIATMGKTDSDDVRLHFEVRKDGQVQDPLEYLPAR
ncbi:peptidoglycan DD-metalloendopeptidase family protein [Halomonas huangheensis]|uniref:LysM domain-containing protein n=1 Tax=Halomonas huangheensis TaxID=1178482 RepID=W1N4M9_9GAMM|nr:peptidoglycan DD-metalloendopeptidase family protein [Halomonas huangheensis]ALM51642.1 hypothetical protein AR456_04580 [Halomonas huangheensis]ERL50126.1 hypothetical protein BJB45_03095 [Halomonas huangheensis]